MRVRLTLEPDDRVCLESPYDRAFVEGLKRAIPYAWREWDGARKRWLVSAAFVAELLDYLQASGCEILDDRHGTGQGAITPLPAMPTDLKEGFDALHLAYTAPLCVAEASYRALSKHKHPDRGGNAEEFSAIHDAIRVIRSYLDPKPDDDLPF